MTSLLCFCFAHLFTGFIAGALLCAGAFGNPSEISRHEDADLLLIIADLETGFGYDDRTLENTRVALDEGNQLIGCHRINIDAALACGMHAILFKNSEQLSLEMKSIGIL